MSDKEERFYRRLVQPEGLVTFTVVHQESDLQIAATRELKKEATSLLLRYRSQLEDYLLHHEEFAHSLVPVKVTEDAPEIVTKMATESARVGVGPMAAVAGAVAEFIGNDLLDLSPELIIENGGDIFLRSQQERIISVYAGNSPLSMKLGIKLWGAEEPRAVCTSSGTVGHSLSFGKADGVVIVGYSATFCDAAATAVCNLVKAAADIKDALTYLKPYHEVICGIVIIGDQMGAWGDLELVKF